MTKKEINASCIGKKVYVLTEYGGWYGQIKDAFDDSFLVANSRNSRESIVDIFSIRWPEDPVLE
jgi:hypothetical protein